MTFCYHFCTHRRARGCTHARNGLFTFALKSAISNRCFSPLSLFHFEAFTFQFEHDKRMNLSIKLIHQLKCQKRQLNVNQLKCQDSKLSLDTHTQTHTTNSKHIHCTYISMYKIRKIDKTLTEYYYMLCYTFGCGCSTQAHTHREREHRTSTEQRWHGLIRSIKLWIMTMSR